MYKKLLETFTFNIDGLRDFVDLIQPMLNDYHNKEFEKYDKAFEPIELARQIQNEIDENKKIKLKERLKEIFNGEIEVNTEEINDLEDKNKSKKITFQIKGDTKKINEAFQFSKKSKLQKKLLYVNALFSLLSSAEWFYSQILHYFYDNNPNSAGIKKKTLTLEELKSFGSVNDAEKYLIDSKIEVLLRSSLTDWIDTLKEELGLKMGYLNLYIDELVELYQRRNLFVHNGGIVNSIYHSKVNNCKYSIGEQLDVTEDYLDKAIDIIHVLFSLIACELWKKELPDDKDRAYFLMELSYSYLKKSKWEIAKLPNTFLSKDASQPTIPKTYAQLNCWLCDKKINGLEKIKAELFQQDFSDKTVVIQLALEALKENEDTFFELLPKAINSEELPLKYLFDFPILEEMRKSNKFHNFVLKNKKVKEYKENLETNKNNS